MEILSNTYDGQIKMNFSIFNIKTLRSLARDANLSISEFNSHGPSLSFFCKNSLKNSKKSGLCSKHIQIEY